MKGVVRSLVQNNPCEECRAHAAKYFQDDWLTKWKNAIKAEDVFTHTVEIHNDVNARLGKTVWSVGAARARWEQRDITVSGGVPCMVLVGGVMSAMLLGVWLGRAGQRCEINCKVVDE